MNRLYEDKERLESLERKSFLLMDKFNTIINEEIDTDSLKSALTLYEYKRIQIKENLCTSDEQDNCELYSFVDSLLDSNNTFSDLDNISSKSITVLTLMENFKKALKEIYRAENQNFWHISSTAGLKKINASTKRLNVYGNELVDGIFSSSSYNLLLLYVGRAIAGYMYFFFKKFCLYPLNPYGTKIGDDISLVGAVYAYSLDIETFEPVVDFRLIDGKYMFLFSGEWVSRERTLPCAGTLINSVPAILFNSCEIFCGSNDINIERIGHSCIGRSENEVKRILAEEVMAGNLENAAEKYL